MTKSLALLADSFHYVGKQAVPWTQSADGNISLMTSSASLWLL